MPFLQPPQTHPRFVYAPGMEFWGHLIFVCPVLSVNLSVTLWQKNFNLGHNFWTVTNRDFIFGLYTQLIKQSTRKLPDRQFLLVKFESVWWKNPSTGPVVWWKIQIFIYIKTLQSGKTWCGLVKCKNLPDRLSCEK